jgi:antitoxin (DNA-binding transcriptional repressor) of toxin-antitoxin stability system
MEQMAISKFKATCLAVLEKVKRTGEPVLVTRFGQPVAEIYPVRAVHPARRFGLRTQTGTVLADIVGPTGDESDWETRQDPGDESK